MSADRCQHLSAPLAAGGQRRLRRTRVHRTATRAADRVVARRHRLPPPALQSCATRLKSRARGAEALDVTIPLRSHQRDRHLPEAVRPSVGAVALGTTRGQQTLARLDQVEAKLDQLEWARRRAAAAATRRQRVATARADLVIGGVLLASVFDGDWRRLAHWLAPQLRVRDRARLADPLPSDDRTRRRRLHWVLARTGRAARGAAPADATADLLERVRGCLCDPRERALLAALAPAMHALPTTPR